MTGIGIFRQKISPLSFVLLLLVVTLARGEWKSLVNQGNFGDFKVLRDGVQEAEEYHLTDFFAREKARVIPGPSPGGVPLPPSSRTGPGAVVSASPFHMAVFGVLHSADLALDFRVFQAVNFLCLGFTLLLFTWWFSYEVNSALALLVFFLLSFSPHLADLGNGNITHVLVAMTALGLLLRAGKSPMAWVSCGVVLGLTLMLKPILLFVPFPLLIFALFRRQGREAVALGAGLFLGIVGAFLAGGWYFHNFSTWISWLEMIHYLAIMLPKDPSALLVENFGFPVLIRGLTGLDLPGFVSLAWGAALFTRVIWLCRLSASGTGNLPEREGRSSVVSRFLQTGAAMMVFYPLWGSLVWGHYFMFCIPLVLMLLSPAWQAKENSWNRILIFTFLTMVALDPIRVFVDLPLLAAGWMSWVGTLGLFLVGTARPFPVVLPIPERPLSRD